MSNGIQVEVFGSLPSLLNQNRGDHVKSMSILLKMINDRYAVLDLPQLRHPEKEEDPRSFTLHALLIMVCEKDEMNGISHAYQKLKGFYKGLLNLGPDYIRDVKTEEWLNAVVRNTSVHEME
ncbi:hypothetical protein Tco_1556961 [Tanacetum coccineum]